MLSFVNAEHPFLSVWIWFQHGLISVSFHQDHRVTCLAITDTVCTFRAGEGSMANLLAGGAVAQLPPPKLGLLSPLILNGDSRPVETEQECEGSLPHTTMRPLEAWG